MSTLFPRGGLKTEDTPKKDGKKDPKDRKKRKDRDADLLATRKPAKRENKAPATDSATTEQQQSTPLDVLTTTTIVKAGRGKPAKLRPVRFASYHAETTVLGVVRSASAKHALVSLPGNLVGHVDVSGALNLTPNTIVRCAVLSTSRAGAAPGGSRGDAAFPMSDDAANRVEPPFITVAQLRAAILSFSWKTASGPFEAAADRCGFFRTLASRP